MLHAAPETDSVISKLETLIFGGDAAHDHELIPLRFNSMVNHKWAKKRIEQAGH